LPASCKTPSRRQRVSRRRRRHRISSRPRCVAAGRARCLRGAGIGGRPGMQRRARGRAVPLRAGERAAVLLSRGSNALLATQGESAPVPAVGRRRQGLG
jgi:hypothetical protein